MSQHIQNLFVTIYYSPLKTNNMQSNILCRVKRSMKFPPITYLFPLEFFSRTFTIFQVPGTRSMAVTKIMFSSFFILLTPVIAKTIASYNI